MLRWYLRYYVYVVYNSTTILTWVEDTVRVVRI